MKQFSSSNHTKQYLRDLLELAKQRMLSGIPTNITNATNVTSSQQLSTSSSSSSNTIEQVLMNANIVEIVIGVGYVFIIVAFLVKLFLKTLRRFEHHFGSSHDGAYNRFGFIANEESDFDSSDNDSDGENNFDDDVVESSSSSPVSQRHALIPLVTPLQKITTVTPHTPSPPPVRRSLRLKIKSELNLTSTMEKQNKTNVVTRSQTRRRNQRLSLAISSEPAPSSSLNQSHGAIITPSLHPENDEELAYYLQRCYERKMKKRSEFNSPLVVRRLVL